MPKYVFVINGQNFKVRFEDNIQNLGSYTTRQIEEDRVDKAEKLALDSIRAELKDLVLNDREDPPMLYIESVNEVGSFEDYPVPGDGCTWYDENKEREE